MIRRAFYASSVQNVLIPDEYCDERVDAEKPEQGRKNSPSIFRKVFRAVFFHDHH